MNFCQTINIIGKNGKNKTTLIDAIGILYIGLKKDSMRKINNMLR